ncbi:MAG: ABC transporter ATP-binding protein [Holophaga sp.]
MTNLLEVRHISKAYGNFALQSVDLDVPRGTITGLVGANGAGKSTLIKLVLGLVPPDAGEIRIFGQNALPSSSALRQRIGFVQESPTLYGHLRVTELGQMVAPFYTTWNEATFRRLCDLFELPLKKPFSKLSQGTRMKTALALALSHDADLLLLDEPTSGLDPLARREVLDLLLEVIQDENKAVLFSTHITSDLERVADHVAVLREGRMVLAGAKDDLLESWVLVKGGDELLAGPLSARCRGGQRTELSVTLLCEKNETLDSLLPANAIQARPSLEDLVFFHGRAVTLDPRPPACWQEEAPCCP